MPGWAARLAQRVAQDVQHRRRREVADLAQRAPDSSNASSRRPRAALIDSRTLGPPGWRHPRADVVDRQVVVGQEAGDVVGQIALDEVGQIGDSTSRKPEAPTSQPIMPSESGYSRLRDGEHIAARSMRRPAGRDARRQRPPPRRRRRTARCPRGGHRRLAAPERQRTQLHRHQHGDIVGRTAQIVVQPRDARRAGHAAQAEDRHALARRAAAPAGPRCGRPATAPPRRSPSS